MGQSMNNCERVEMLRLMAEELNDSISEERERQQMIFNRY